MNRMDRIRPSLLFQTKPPFDHFDHFDHFDRLRAGQAQDRLCSGLFMLRS
jgi:hypothetical protein